MMLRPLLLILLSLAMLPAAVTSHAPHAPQVLRLDYQDPAPRGAAHEVTVHLENATQVQHVRLIYCRVQNYACGPALTMQPEGGQARVATIPWTSRFFEDVRQVGLRLQLELENGSLVHSPVEHYPSRPADLPPEADTYYYYGLQARSSHPGPLLGLLVLGLAAVMRR